VREFHEKVGSAYLHDGGSAAHQQRREGKGKREKDALGALEDGEVEAVVEVGLVVRAANVVQHRQPESP